MFPVYNPHPHPHQYYPYYPTWSHGYPAPMEYHGCCNHDYPPPPPPPSPYCHTSPPTPHGPYPFSAGSAYPPYQVPSRFFMEQPSPRYEYDKDMHCCGCPNHVCQPKQQNRGVRIEEHEPEAVNKEDSDASAPAKFQGEYPAPYVWFPPEYIKDKDGTKFRNWWRPIGLKNDNYGRDEKLSESSTKAGDTKPNNDQSNEDKKPFPFPMFRRLGESSNKESKGETASESAQNDADVKANNQNNAPFPFPVFWFPDYGRLKESESKDMKASDSSPQVMEERQPKLKIIPVKSPGNNDRKENPGATDEVSQVNDSHVQPNGETGRNGSSEVEERPKEIHVRQVKQDEEPRGKNSRSQSSSPRKASKLPPVCLRVDPLPRRRSGGEGGTSRSPSPPAAKSKVCQEESVQPSGTEVPRKCDHVPTENVDRSASTKEIPGTRAATDLVSASQVNETSETVSNIPMEDNKTKQKLSITEAAVVIQSFYRGFQLRKWQPLNKLKQIAKVREQVNEIGARVRTLESYSESRKDEKQRILISEAIMSLLLQLDTIQGLHPTVRDIRKSVAKELTTMQEKLDSLFSLSAAEEHMPELTNTQHAPFPLDIGDVEPESVERNPMETEHQLKAEEQRPILAEMDSTEQAAGVDPQFTEDDLLSAKPPRDTEPGSDFSSKPSEKAKEADQQLLAGDTSGEADQQLLDENQIYTESPPETEPRNDFPSKPTALSPAESESRYDHPMETSEKVEESDPQLLAIDEASGQAHQALPAEDQLSAISLTENESRNDCPPETVDQPLEVDDQDSSTKSSSSSDAQSEKDCHLAFVGEIQVIGEAMEDDEVTGEPGCCHGEVKPLEESRVEVTEMAGGIGQSAEAAMVVMDQRACSGVQTPDSTKERNPSEDRSIVDIAASGLVAEPLGEELREVLDELPLCNVDNNQGGGLENNLEEEPTLVRDAENESESGNSILKGDEESRCMASEYFQGALECPIMKEDNVDEQPPENNVDMAVEAGGASGECGEMGVVVVDKKKLAKENENLRDVLGKLIEEGEKQMKVISDLNGRIKELERKLTKKNKVRMTSRRASAHPKQRV